MRTNWKLAGVSLAVGITAILVAAPHPALAEKHKKEGAASATATGAKGDSAQDAMMAEMMKYATPGPAHQKLKNLVGKWKAVTKSWMGPGDPQVSEGEVEYRMVLGGRYLDETYKGTMMGQPFEGHGMTGFDNRKQQYWNFWVDNMSTGGMQMMGTANEVGDEITFTGTGEGPDGNPMQYKTVMKLMDPNKHVFSMYGVMGDKEMEVMEVTYTRR